MYAFRFQILKYLYVLLEIRDSRAVQKSKCHFYIPVLGDVSEPGIIFLKFVDRLLGFSGKTRTFIASKAEYVYES